MVDMEGELISALEEIDRLILNKRKQKQLLMHYEKNGKEPSEDISLSKLELEQEKNRRYSKTTINKRKKEMESFGRRISDNEERIGEISSSISAKYVKS